jgi:hypothetical protein
MRRHTVTATTDASGDVTAYSPRLAGFVHSIHYVKPGSGSYTDGVDFAITAEATGVGLWTEANVNASASRLPRQPVHDQVGVAATLDGTRAMRSPVALANDRVKIVVSSGGASKVGSFIIVLDD